MNPKLMLGTLLALAASQTQGTPLTLPEIRPEPEKKYDLEVLERAEAKRARKNAKRKEKGL